MGDEMLEYFEPISSENFQEEAAIKVKAFLVRKMKSTLPLMLKLRKEKYSLYGITKTQMHALLPKDIFKKLIAFEPSKKLFISETIFVFHYKKGSQVEFSVGYQSGRKY